LRYDQHSRIGLIVGEKEGEAMKKDWLRGVLLGVSLALLLAGGVALAAPSARVEPYCGVCCEGTWLDAANNMPPCDDYWTITTSGWQPGETLNVDVDPPGSLQLLTNLKQADAAGNWDARLILVCEYRGEANLLEDLIIYSGPWKSAGAYGEWEVTVEGASSGKVDANFFFAEDPGVCQAMEFVPEPGSILLLGSGLAGLAGYAGLRWRMRD
jgi:hypothetical protein